LKKKTYISVTNDLFSDQRVHRTIAVLLSLNANVCAIGRKLNAKYDDSDNAFNIHRFNMLFRKGFLFYAFYNLRLFFYLISRKKIDLLVSNDLDTLLANFLVSKLRSCKLVFDSHEYFTELPELEGRGMVKHFWKGLEKWIVPKLRYACTVNESLADIFKNAYGTDFKVVRNLPYQHADVQEYTTPEWTKGKHLILYQGSVNIGRGLEMMIDIVKDLSDYVFIIAGTGDILNTLKEKVQAEDLQQKVILTGRLSPGRLRSLTNQADIGISLEQNLGLNYYFALPNKIFDYIQAGIPVLCSDFPEMRNIVLKYKIGRFVASSDKNEVRKAILEMIENKQDSLMWKQNSEKASVELSWENEQKVLIELINSTGIFK